MSDQAITDIVCHPKGSTSAGDVVLVGTRAWQGAICIGPGQYRMKCCGVRDSERSVDEDHCLRSLKKCHSEAGNSRENRLRDKKGMTDDDKKG